MLTKLKEHLQQLLSSQAKTANQLGFTPNAISVVGLVLSGSSGAAYALALNQPWLLPLW
jgi:hypothetical protein